MQFGFLPPNTMKMKCQGNYKNCEGEAVALLNKKYYCKYCFFRKRNEFRIKRNLNKKT